MTTKFHAMDKYALFERHVREKRSFEQDRRASYDAMRRRGIKLLWQVCRVNCELSIEYLMAIIDEAQRWEREWGRKGERERALYARHDKEWDEMYDHLEIIRYFRSTVSKYLN